MADEAIGVPFGAAVVAVDSSPGDDPVTGAGDASGWLNPAALGSFVEKTEACSAAGSRLVTFVPATGGFATRPEEATDSAFAVASRLFAAATPSGIGLGSIAGALPLSATRLPASNAGAEATSGACIQPAS